MYESFYNFKAKPFQLSPDPRFFFNSKGHKRALSYLRYGIRQGEGFIIITGNVGTGKTTLVTALFKALERENVVAAQVVTTNLQADELLKVVANAFGMKSERIGKAALLKNLESFFRACTQEGKRVLLVVDEAQGLPKKSIEELRMLSNFQYQGRALLQTFMLGQREFRTTMRSEGFEQLRQRVIAAYHLKPLDAAETKGYIRHRLATVGWNDNPKLDPLIYEAIHEFTDGVPRRINTLCDRLFLYGALEELDSLDIDDLRSVTHDIREEQGATTQELAEIGPVMESKAPRMQTTEPQGRADPPGEDRLVAMEASVASLADAMREELSVLRRALTDRTTDGADKKG
ncbi:MAG: AAA family ATPase [Chromatiales bacterium]|jgi:general secretion pathway protein A|nr:AAA family ATPase [Chromatiales bacterium]